MRTLYADDAILSLAFSPDGEKLAAGLRNGRVQAWNLSNGEVTLSLDWQYNPVLQVAFSADGEILAFTTGGSFIYLSQVEDGTAIERINAIIPQDICLEFSPDGTILASCSSNAVQLWGVSDGSPLTSLGVPAGKPAQLAFSPDGAMVAASSSTGIYLWRVAEGDLQIFGDSPGEGLAFSEDGQNIICGCDGKIEVWDRSNGQLNQTYELGRYRLPGLVFSTADQILVSSLKNGRVRSWKVDLDMSAVPTIPSADDDETTPSVTEVISQDKATATLMEISPSATPLPSHTPPPAHQPIDFKINPVDSADIVLVPAGEFIMGSNPEIDPYFWGAEGPQHEVYLDEYWIYKNEVSTAMYQECEQANACPRPVHNDSNITDQYYGNPQFADYPVLYVSHTHAASYCQWAGGDLPTEAQWEKAARGTNVFLFPWGDQAPTGERANLCDSRCGRDERQDNIDDGYPGPAPIGNFPAGASPYGAMDMAGNAWEWTGDIFDPEYYYVSPVENPTGPASGSRYVIRGGGWNNPNSGVRSVARASLKPNQALDTLGFRCVILSP